MQMPDLNEMVNTAVRILVEMLAYPFKLWARVPIGVKYSLLGFVFFICLAIIVLLIRYRDEWRHR